MRASLEWTHAELHFQPRHLVADGGCREVKLRRGVREAAAARDSFETRRAARTTASMNPMLTVSRPPITSLSSPATRAPAPDKWSLPRTWWSF